MSNIAISKIAKLLRMPNENVLVDLFSKMEKLTGKKGVAERIFEENNKIVSQKLADIGISADKADAQNIEAEILRKTGEADSSFFEFLGKPDFGAPEGYARMIELAKEIKPGEEKGFFLKEDKLRDFIFLNPPKNIIKELGYKDAKELLEKENIYHIFAALRFAENERWLNEFFMRPYHDLIPDNFEEREIKIEILPKKWAEIGEKFVGKKLHNISHLKEAGMIFVVPTSHNGFSGQSLETFTLILHYLYEVKFYSELFQKHFTLPNFGLRLVEFLAAKVSSLPLSPEANLWRIIPRYLAKLNDSDPRLFEPHINPEPLHWMKAENDIDSFVVKNPQIKLDFWRGTDDFTGDIFPAGKKGEDVVSFDLIDNIISLSRGSIGKYMYHQQEALWNKIFIEFMGTEKIEEVIMDNLEKGYVELK
jgi:hypothetical protein